MWTMGNRSYHENDDNSVFRQIKFRHRPKKYAKFCIGIPTINEVSANIE